MRAWLSRVPAFAWLFAAVVVLSVAMGLGLQARGALAAWLWPEHRAALAAGPGDVEQGVFARCRGGHRVTCVIDGDTIWYQGVKIRVADINAPEISEPACDAELELGEKAAMRMTALLNGGRFSLRGLPSGRDADVYGRQLRVIMRGGRSLGMVLVDEGLAERWVGFRRDWCD